MYKEFMEKKKYITPAIEVVGMTTENIMITASPGQGIEAKKNNVFEDETADEWPSYSAWDE